MKLVEIIPVVGLIESYMKECAQYDSHVWKAIIMDFIPVLPVDQWDKGSSRSLIFTQ